MRSVPNLAELTLDRDTGRVYLLSPLNQTTLSNYDRVRIEVAVFQLQNEPVAETSLGNVYLFYVTCSAVIYLPSVHASTQKTPYFIRDYTAVVDRESVTKTKAIVKLDAVSLSENQRNSLILYTIVGDDSNALFVIDRMQGYIYPRYDYGLAVNTYVVDVSH